MMVSRKWLRLLHLAATPLFGAVVYSESLRAAGAFLLLLQLLVFPLAAASGLWMWLGPRLARRAAARGGA